MWPIDGSDSDELDAAVRDFAVEALLVPATVVRDTKFAEIICVRSSPNNKVYLEAPVTFKDTADRDFYFSKSRDLPEYRNDDGSPSAGLQLDILPSSSLLSSC